MNLQCPAHPAWPTRSFLTWCCGRRQRWWGHWWYPWWWQRRVLQWTQSGRTWTCSCEEAEPNKRQVNQRCHYDMN